MGKESELEKSFITDEPFYIPVGAEADIFGAAYRNGLPVLLKGPTGCGKTRFVEHMAWKLRQSLTKGELNTGGEGFLVTIPCHEDLTANDLIGRFFLTLDQGAIPADDDLRHVHHTIATWQRRS